MRCTEILKARVSPQVKRQASAIAERDLLTEAAWLKRLVIRVCALPHEECYRARSLPHLKCYR